MFIWILYFKKKTCRKTNLNRATEIDNSTNLHRIRCYGQYDIKAQDYLLVGRIVACASFAYRFAAGFYCM